ncbi:hypothetical protein DERP_000160 [Dermatophagoides pteronyssinus]|uniref:Uncharacterized protein n=1 Tax=Dermatophagoides pteronyssinus TaxID=6956 RepID=A0ABQ8IZD3_DERPT|nr:hypothetical protein DERP_000160 [Dermatophagoides pteronyssinus]
MSLSFQSSDRFQTKYGPHGKALSSSNRKYDKYERMNKPWLALNTNKKYRHKKFSIFIHRIDRDIIHE